MLAIKHGIIYLFFLVLCLFLVVVATIPPILFLGEEYFFLIILSSMTLQFALFGTLTAVSYKYLFDFNVFDVSKYIKPTMPILALTTLGGMTVGFLPSWVLQQYFPSSGTMDLIQELIADGSLAEKLYFILIASLVGPIVEEFMFRGYLWDLFKTSFSERLTLLVTTSIFAVIHFDPIQGIGVFFLGLYFGWLRMKTDSILVPVAAHVGNNAMASFMMFLLPVDSAISITTVSVMSTIFVINLFMFRNILPKKE